MPELTKTQQNILQNLIKNGPLGSSNIRLQLLAEGEKASLVTVRRWIIGMEKEGLLVSTGIGRATAYEISGYGRMVLPVDAREYSSIEPDKRHGQTEYKFALLDSTPPSILSGQQVKSLETATAVYAERIANLSTAIRDKELERFIIELSWKSSKIEGNTYTLLDTENLIRRGIEAPGHGKDEARMILNHKDAFKFIQANMASFTTLTKAGMQEVHKILIGGLNVNAGFRSKPVGVTGSTYRPLDNIHQITDAVEALCAAVQRLATPYEKALLTLLGIRYIQPFEDGNKRTSRLMANAILLAHGCAPLSYRSVDENDYREAMLVFYELNSMKPFEKIFIEQYIFAAENYLIGK